MAQLTTVSNGQLSDASMWNQYKALFTGGQVYDVVAGYGADPTGVADSTAAIQAALTAGAGHAVFVPAGTYKVSGTLTISANTTVWGSGTLLLAAGANLSGPILYFNGAGITVRDLTLDGNKANQTTGNTSDGLVNVYFTGSKVINVTIQNAWNRGILVYQGSDHLIQGCTVLSCGHVTATDSTMSGIFITAAARIRILGNRVESSNGSNILFDATSTACTIADNIVKTAFYIGIGLGNTCQNMTIVGNTIDGTGQGAGAIDIGTVTGCTVSGNTAFATVSGNCAGVVNGGPSFNVTITGNSFENMWGGIWYGGGTGANIKNNTTITGNSCVNMFDAGIQIIDCGSVTVANNICMNCGNGTAAADNKTGIQIYGNATQGWCDSISIIGNRCGDDQTAKTQSYGLRVVGASNTRILVDGNNFTGNATSAISNDSSAGTTTGTNITA